MRVFLILLCLYIFTLPVNADVVKISLDEAIDIALENNLDLLAKRKELKIADAEIKIANRLQNPQVQANVLVGKITTGNSSQAGLMFPIETFKRGVRKKAAIAQKKAVENQIKQAEHELKIKVMKAYFEVLYYKSVEDIMIKRKKLFEDMKKIASEKSRTGGNYKIDSLQADIKYKKQLIELNRSKAELMNAQFEFNKTINVPADEKMYDTQESSLFDDDLTILDIQLPPYETIEATALKYSYSIRITDNNIEKYGQEYVLAKRQRIPDLMIGGGFAWQTKYNGEGDNWPGAFVGGGFNLPVLYSYRPDIDKAATILQKTQMDKASFENKLKITLKQNYNNFKYARQNMDYYKDILKESDEILKTSTDMYKTGDITLINLIWTENNHQTILNEYLTAMDVYYGGDLNMMHNIGHDLLLEEDIFEDEN